MADVPGSSYRFSEQLSQIENFGAEDKLDSAFVMILKVASASMRLVAAPWWGGFLTFLKRIA